MNSGPRYAGTSGERRLPRRAGGTHAQCRDILRHVLLRDGDKRGATSGLMVLGLEEGDYLLDDVVYAINRRTLDPSQRRDIVQMLDEIEAEGSR